MAERRCQASFWVSAWLVLSFASMAVSRSEGSAFDAPWFLLASGRSERSRSMQLRSAQRHVRLRDADDVSAHGVSRPLTDQLLDALFRAAALIALSSATAGRYSPTRIFGASFALPAGSALFIVVRVFAQCTALASSPKHLTRRWSQPRAAVRPSFPMTPTSHPAATRALAQRWLILFSLGL